MYRAPDAARIFPGIFPGYRETALPFSSDDIGAPISAAPKAKPRRQCPASGVSNMRLTFLLLRPGLCCGELVQRLFTEVGADARG